MNLAEPNIYLDSNLVEAKLNLDSDLVSLMEHFDTKEDLHISTMPCEIDLTHVGNLIEASQYWHFLYMRKVM